MVLNLKFDRFSAATSPLHINHSDLLHCAPVVEFHYALTMWQVVWKLLISFDLLLYVP